MGRGKIEIKRIENSGNRQVTFSKRKNGILKKAKEISVLCDAKVSLVIFPSTGKMLEYCSPSANLSDMLELYQKQTGKKLWDAKHENLNNEIDRVKKENDNMQIELRRLKGEDMTSLNHHDLIAMEDALEHGLDKVRYQQMEYLRTLRRNGKIQEEENRQINFQLQQLEMEVANNARAMENGAFQLTMGDHYNADPQLPPAFRTQQNLHNRI